MTSRFVWLVLIRGSAKLELAIYETTQQHELLNKVLIKTSLNQFFVGSPN